jgi:hypothetical protein
MASFMEAMKAAREGKRVRCRANYRWCWWREYRLEFVDGDCPWIADYVLDDVWEIESKKYTFLEAVALMEQGKTMLSPNGMRTKLRSTLLANENNGPKMLLLEEINGMWTEETQS